MPVVFPSPYNAVTRFLAFHSFEAWIVNYTVSVSNQFFNASCNKVTISLFYILQDLVTKWKQRPPERHSMWVNERMERDSLSKFRLKCPSETICWRLSLTEFLFSTISRSFGSLVRSECIAWNFSRKFHTASNRFLTNFSALGDDCTI